MSENISQNILKNTCISNITKYVENPNPNRPNPALLIICLTIINYSYS